MIDPVAIQMLWDDFITICDAVEAHPDDTEYLEPDELKRKCKDWAEQFRKDTFDEDVIPYIHGNKILNNIVFNYCTCNLIWIKAPRIFFLLFC